MDWNLAIEKNREALRGVLVMLVAMVASATGEIGGDRPRTLPRHLHRLVLRLVRPAESAARRLIIVAARGLVVQVRSWRPRKPKQNAMPRPTRRNGYGTNMLIRPGPLPEWAKALVPKRSVSRSLPLLDPMKRFGVRRNYVKWANMPRIALLGGDDFKPYFQQPLSPVPVPPSPSPDDPLDATRLARRLEAIGRVLDDLPREAQRFARWRARRDARLAGEDDAAGGQHGSSAHSEAAGAERVRRFQRLGPMRPGRPPGWQRKPSHRIDEVLNDLHGLAIWMRDHPDTS